MSETVLNSVPRREYAMSVLGVAGASAISFALHSVLEPTNLVMVYLIATVVVAARGYRGPAALSACLSVACFDFFFVPPRFRFSVADAQYLLTFVVMFATAMLISHLVIQLRERALAAENSQQQAVWLLEKAKKAEIEAESERLRSSLLSSVSHDLKTPLAAIRGSAEALLDKPEFARDAGARELLENIEEEGARLTRLVENLLEVTRLESGQVRLQKEPHSLEDLVGAALGRLEKPLGARPVEMDLPEDLPLVPLDPVLIEQLLINLIENAIRHAPAGSAIEIAARRHDHAVVLSVADRGPGLKEGDETRVFEKFYRQAGSPGAGLGLAICRAIAASHGGQITAGRRPGGGAVFQLTLPLDA